MSQSRTLPLLDLKAQPQSWNERMAPGEYAVLYSGLPEGSSLDSISCTVFGSLAEAETYAKEQVGIYPGLRCRIYDHHGFGSQPVREIRGKEHKNESEISARLRRWAGTGLFVGGAVLIVVDWVADFNLLWPAMLGMRMMPVGLILLLTELVIVIEARRKQRRADG
ncbi:hypothetical protein [Granulicella sp. dw_53]|uniref:hypothetical protein n=1 Tax=Granulicella sp. dw_53 TaxID=2719792 RepID=UPI00210237A4|nr:hypothetical protein [Granulicella sp. dw_53]